MTSNTAASPPTYFRYEFLDAAPHELQIYQKVVHQVVLFESFATALWAEPLRKQGGRIRPQFLRVNACARFCLRREVWVSTKDYFLPLIVKVGAFGDVFEVVQSILTPGEHAPSRSVFPQVRGAGNFRPRKRR